MHNWHVYNKFSDAEQSAADFLAESIITTISKNSICHVVLPGGNTPKKCLGLLASKILPWEKVHWYLGDERCYEKNHNERNDGMLQEYFWSNISKSNHHVIPAELGAEQGAASYRTVIDDINLDIAFLGMGEDGHTASLFPGNEALNDQRSVIPIHNSPKPPSDRISLSKTILEQIPIKVVLAGGNEKGDIIKRIQSGESLPINMIGDIEWFIDNDANS